MFAILAACILSGLSAFTYSLCNNPGLVAAAGAGLHTAAEGLAGAVLIVQPAAVGAALAQRYRSRMPGYAEMPM